MSRGLPEKREGRSLSDQRRPSQICDLWQASQVFSYHSLPICQFFRLDPPPISLDHAVFVPRRKREGGADA